MPYRLVRKRARDDVAELDTPRLRSLAAAYGILHAEEYDDDTLRALVGTQRETFARGELLAFIAIGLVVLFGLVLVSGLIDKGKSDRQQSLLSSSVSENRAFECALANLILASPNVYVPAFETRGQYRRITQARGDVLTLAAPIDCSLILSQALPHRNVPGEGGGLQSSPQTGSQLSRGPRAPRHRRSRSQ